MAVTRNVGGFSGAIIAVSLVVLVVTIPRTYSVVVVIWTSAVVAVVVSGVLLKVMLIPGGGTVPVWIFYSQGSLWC